jgi:hypothetical protein
MRLSVEAKLLHDRIKFPMSQSRNDGPSFLWTYPMYETDWEEVPKCQVYLIQVTCYLTEYS